MDLNLTNVEAFEQAGKEILGDYGCLPMIQYGTIKTLSAFKLLAKARDIDFNVSNEVSKQIKVYEADVKHAIENNTDDPDYNVNDDIQIESYVDDQYINLINDSKKYQKIVLTLAPHPCAHLLLDKDIRREIGVIKTKEGYAAFIDGTTADAYGYLKLDLLRVTVVDIIAKTFHAIGLDVMTVDELLKTTENDPAVWDLYAKGYTFSLNQCEQPKSTERVMRFKPKNIVELCAFVGAIRPGFKSMLDTFISRTPFAYNIPSLDSLLQTKEIPSSFLLYDEQVLTVLIAAGIPAADAYVCLKAIKKKKAEKVAPFKALFKDGFSKRLQDEGKSKDEAEKVCDQILTILEDSASYLFNASHAFCVACDSLYVAWLKAHFPYELYKTVLKIYDEKKNKDKVSAIISEMKRYKGIRLLPGRFGQDNRDWLVDKKNATISQSISSIRYLNKEAAEDLYQLGLQDEAEMGIRIIPAVMKPEAKKDIAVVRKKLKQFKAIYDTPENPMMSEEELSSLRAQKEHAIQEGTDLEKLIEEIKNDPKSYEKPAEEIHITAKLDCFTNVLRAIQMNTRVNMRMVEVLIGIGYFSKFGKTGKLMRIFKEFNEGRISLSRTIKSFEQRLDILRDYEASLKDEDLPAGLRLQMEYENVGICLTVDPSAPSNLYFVEEVDSKFSVKAKLYSVQRGTTGTVRVAKKLQEQIPLQEGLCMTMENYSMRPRCSFKNGKRIPIPGEEECWVTNYSISYEPRPAVA